MIAKNQSKMRILIYFKTIGQSPQTYFFGPVTAYLLTRGSHGRDRMVVGFITTYAISAYHHLCCDFESHSGEVYAIQQYVIKFLSDLRQVGGFLRVLRFPPPIKLTATITEILLKLALNTITFPPLLTILIALIQNKSPKVTG